LLNPVAMYQDDHEQFLAQLFQNCRGVGGEMARSPAA
jgi:hypothetical protein